jgi:hypothetical protein
MNRAAYSAAFSTFGPSGRHRSAERGNGVKQPPTMPDQRDTKILEISAVRLGSTLSSISSSWKAGA